MPKGYRRRYGAIGLIAGLCLTAGNLLAQDKPVAPSPKGNPTAQSKGAPVAAPITLNVTVNPVVQEPPCDEACEKERKRAADHDVDDLAAQDSSALSARVMAWIGGIQLLVGVVTLGFLVVTFRETKRTANAAVAAAVAAQKTADLERPYLVVAELPVSFIARKPTEDVMAQIGAIVKNSGSRTGIIRSVAIQEVEALPEFPTQPLHFDWIGKTSVPGDGEHKIHFIHMMYYKPPAKVGVLRNTDIKFLFGYIRYSDIRGATWRSGFCFSYTHYGTGDEDAGLFFNAGSAAFWYDTEETEEQRRQDDQTKALVKALTEAQK